MHKLWHQCPNCSWFLETIFIECSSNWNFKLWWNLKENKYCVKYYRDASKYLKLVFYFEQMLIIKRNLDFYWEIDDWENVIIFK